MGGSGNLLDEGFLIYCTWGMWVQNHPRRLFYPPFTLVFGLCSSWLGGRGDPKISVVGACEEDVFLLLTRSRAASSCPTRLSRPLAPLLLHATARLCASPAGREVRVLTSPATHGGKQPPLPFRARRWPCQQFPGAAGGKAPAAPAVASGSSS